MTVIDPATGWREIPTVLSARADLIYNQVELVWSTCYPLPIKAIVDRGNEFLAELGKMLIIDYIIKVSLITSRIPKQAQTKY